MDRFLMHVRKQKHIKIETAKALLRNKSSIGASKDKSSRTAPSAAGKSDKPASSRMKMTSKMSNNKPGNLSQIEENKEKDNEEVPESIQCKSSIKRKFNHYHVC